MTFKEYIEKLEIERKSNLQIANSLTEKLVSIRFQVKFRDRLLWLLNNHREKLLSSPNFNKKMVKWNIYAVRKSVNYLYNSLNKDS